jgi:surface protein
LGTNETITSAYIELTNDNYQTRVDDILAYYPNCINVNLYDDGSVVNLVAFMSAERNGINNQVENVTFMEGYFRNVKRADNAFRWCTGLKTVSNLPNSLEITGSMFRFCTSLESVTNIPTNVTNVTEMFYHTAIREVPPFPSNYVGKFEGVFYECENLIEAPIIPDGVTSMATCFMNCRSLTTVPNIPSNCTNFNATFSECTNLTSVPVDGWNGYMGNTFLNCTSLNQEINITNANTLAQTFKGCTSLSITPSIETDPTVTNVNMDNCFEDCTNLIIPPITPSNVKSMGRTYRRCTNLEVAPNIPSDATYIAYMLSNCKKIKEVTIPIGIIEVGNNYAGVIEGCSALENVDWDGNIGISLNLSLLLLSVNISERDFHELIARTTTGKWSSTTLTLSDEHFPMLTGGEIMNLTNKGWTIANFGSTSTATVKSYETISKDMTISTTNEDVTALVIELTSDNYKTRIDEILAYYPNVNDISFYDDGSVTNLDSMFGIHIPSSGDYNNNRNHKNQITHVTFIDGYFENLVGLSYAFCECRNLLFVNNIPNNVTVMDNTFRGCSGLIGISNIPTSVRNLGSCFHSCSSFNQMIDLSNVDIDNSIVAGSLIYLFYNCTSLTYTPILPSNYVGGIGGLQNAFQNCQALKEVPIIPSGITSLSNCFNNCISMTGKPVVPSGVTSMANAFYNTKITEVTIPLDKLMNYQNAVTLCNELENIIWVGTRNTDFSMTSFCHAYENEEDIHELIEHLGNVENATLTLSDTCIGYLTSEDIISLQEKGWNLNSIDGLALVSVPQDLNISTLTSSETVKMACIELTNSNYTSRIGNVLALYPNCNHLIFYEDGSITKFENLFALGNNGAGAYRSQVEKISFAEGYFKNVNTLGGTFSYCNGLKTVENIPLSSKVTYLGNMFMGCTSLNQPIDLSTCVNCTNLSQTFRDCTSLTYTPILPSNCNVMNNCFQSCKALTEVPIMPSGVTNLSNCFNVCTSLTSVNATGWVTNQVTNIAGIFANCTSLTSVNTTDWDTSKVTNMGNIFSNCNALTEIIGIENWDTSQVTNMGAMFSQCEKLTSLNISNWKTGQVVDMGGMFYGVHIAEPLNLNKWDVSKVDTMLNMFRATHYTSIDISSWDTSNVVNFETMFMQCRATELKLPSKFVRSIEGKVTNVYRMFNQSSVTSLDVTEWDTQNINSLIGVFMMCTNLTEIKGIENWDTSKVTNMNQLFYQCKKLTSLNINGWKTGQVTNMGSMFDGCSALESIDISNWDVSKVTNMNSMFSNTGISYMPITTFGNGTNYYGIYSDCSKLTNIPTLTINGSCNLCRLFASCRNLPSSITFNWQTDEKVDVSGMFCDTPSTKYESLYGFNLTSCGETIFTGYFFGDISGQDAQNFKNFTCTGTLSYSMNLSLYPNLSKESLTQIKNCLCEDGIGLTLTLGANNMSKFSEDELLSMTNKGWTIA